ncbi:MAG TPA: winged helix-turn-helix domain-containing protein [Actinomycetota bacterium]|nr:winged helix-turn-helix domain-containing protein [Actinomycetota bacterium]
MTDYDAGALADGLWKRLRDVILVAERVDTFVFGPGDTGELPKVILTEQEAATVATDFVQRALAAACDRTNFRILEAASADDGIAAADLAATLSLPVLVVSERVGDLLQTGLVSKALDTGRVYATAAGMQTVALVRDVAGRLAKTALKARGENGSNHELPVL